MVAAANAVGIRQEEALAHLNARTRAMSLPAVEAYLNYGAGSESVRRIIGKPAVKILKIELSLPLQRTTAMPEPNERCVAELGRIRGKLDA
jgi:hypothetical protein